MGDTSKDAAAGKDFGSNIGGIIGRIAAGQDKTKLAKITNSSNSGSITVNHNPSVSVGGIVGYNSKGFLEIDNCTNSGALKGRNSEVFGTFTNIHSGYGGIIGTIGNEWSGGKEFTTTVTNCSNSGKISSFKATDTEKSVNFFAGGIVGRIYAATTVNIADCTNSGEIDTSATTSTWGMSGGIVGGLVCYCADSDFTWSGVSKGDITITRCDNTGKMTAGIWAAGILAAAMQMFSDDVNIDISYCTNTAEIIGGNENTQAGRAVAGGIVGMLGWDTSSTRKQFGNLAIKYCYNEGAVTSGVNSLAAGGIVGYMNGDSLIGNWDDPNNANDQPGTSSEDANQKVNWNNTDYKYCSQRTWLEQLGNTATITCLNASGKVGNIAGVIKNNYYLMSTYAYGNRVAGTAAAGGNAWVHDAGWYIQAQNDSSIQTILPLKAFVALDRTITAIEEKVFDENDYTIESWATFSTALASAKAVTCPMSTGMRGNENLAPIENANTALISAEKALEAPDYTALNQAISDAENLDENDYTTESWAAIATPLADAKTKTTSRSKTEIDAATKALTDAMGELFAPDYIALNEMIAAVEALNELGYTPASWAALEEALAAARDARNSRTQGDINAAANNLIDAKDALVALRYDSLNTVIAQAGAFNENDYTTETWTTFAAALADANAKLTSRDQAEIDAAAQALNDAIIALRNPDYAALDSAILSAENLNDTDYSEEDWAAIQAAIDTAKTYLTCRTQSEIDAAVAALNEAVNGKTPLDYSALNEAIEFALTKTETNYTTETWAALETALANARANITSRVQSEINAAAEALNDAIDALAKPNYEALNEAITEADTEIEENYTTETWAIFEVALADAREKLTSRTQADIDEAAKALDDATKALAEPDRTELGRALSLVTDLDPASYTIDSWEVLLETFEATRGMTSSRSQTEIDKAAADLIAAINSLVELDYTALNSALVKVDDQLNPDDYTIESWEALMGAYDLASIALDSRVQADIDKAAADLEAAIAALKAPDYTALNSAIALGEVCERSDEATDDDWNSFLARLAEAKELTSRSQAEIDEACEALLSAMDKVEGIRRGQLRLEIGAAEALNKFHYTVEDWDDILAAIETAKGYLESKDQDEVDAAAATLKAAIEGKNALDFTAIDKAIADAEALDKDEYTTETWAILADALADAKEKLESRTQTALDGAAETLNDAIEALLAPDYEALEGAIADAEALDKNAYTTDSWAALEEALADAKAKLESKTQADIDAALTALNNAIEALAAPDYTALNNAINAAEALTETDYSVEDWQTILTAIDTAKGYLASRTQADIDAAVTTLNEVVNSKTKLDRTALSDAITNAENLTETDYSEEDWAAILAAIDTAKGYLDSRDQDDIDAAVAALNEAISSKTVIDRTVLQNMITATETLDQSAYTPEDWTALQTVIEEAISALETRSQVEIDTALAALVEAISKGDVDFSALEDAIEKAEALVETDYSEEDWAAILAAIEKAKTYRDAIMQSEVDAAVVALNEAIASKAKIDHSALSDAITDAEKLTETDYSEEDWAAILAAIDTAKGYLDSRDQDEIDAALAALNEAISSKTPIDRATLKEAIEAAENFNEIDYTVEDWTAIQAAINTAKGYLDSRVQADIDAALAALNEAVNGAPKLNHADLNDLIVGAELLDEKEYTAESWAEFKKALEVAKLAAEKRTQAEIDAGKAALDEAIAKLAEVPADGGSEDSENNGNENNFNFSALEAAIEAAQKLDATKYSEASWAKLSAALVNAKKELAKADNQENVDAATKALEDAISALTAPTEDELNANNSSDKNKTRDVSKKKGCKSAITTSAIVLTTVLALGVGFKKKED